MQSPFIKDTQTNMYYYLWFAGEFSRFILPLDGICWFKIYRSGIFEDIRQPRHHNFHFRFQVFDMDVIQDPYTATADAQWKYVGAGNGAYDSAAWRWC